MFKQGKGFGIGNLGIWLFQLFLFCMLTFARLQGTIASETVTYYHGDPLGSPVAATDETGAVIWREEYRPFGERILKEDSGTNDRWYTGKIQEEETGLSYFGARWYDPGIGRFMAMDPADLDPGDFHSFNRYAYANNNPYRYIDPDGRRIVPVGTKWEQAAIYIALAYLWTSNVITASQLNELAGSPNIHTIRFPKPGEVMQNATTGIDANASNGIGTGSETIVNVRKDSAVSTEKGNLFVGSGPSWLAHELLGHGLDKDRGVLQDESINDNTGQLIKEENAMRRANIYRSSMGEETRTEY